MSRLLEYAAVGNGAQLSLPFDINNAPEPTRVARLPSANLLGEMGGFAVSSPSEYVAAMHSMMGDYPGKKPETSTTVAAKALGIDVPQAYAFANFSFMPDAGNWGLMQWPGVNPDALSRICKENAAPLMVSQARVADMALYAGISTKAYEPGWRVEMRDPKATPTTQNLKEMREAESFIYNGSRDYGIQDARERDKSLLSPFAMIMRTFAREIHTYDAWAMWTQYDRAGRPMAYTSLPPGLIRLAMPNQGLYNDRNLFAALIDQTGNPVRAFSRRELTWSVMNPRTDPAAMGYGFPLPEMGMRQIQAFQSAIDLNADQFNKNSIPNGMLLLKGDFFSQEVIDALMREWTNMKRGVSKLWGMPIMAVPEEGDVEMVNFMDLKGEDVRFKDHMNMMLGSYCALSQFPIRRFGMFASGNKKDNEPLPDESTEIQGIDDRGLTSTLQFVEDRYNAYIVWPIWPHLKMRFLNKNPKDDAREYQERTKVRTWKESRAEADMPPLASTVGTEYKALAEIMEMCPEDPAKMGAFQTVAVTMLEAKLGINQGGEDTAKPGAPFPSMKDPASSQAHGHRVGVRRPASSNKE